MVMGSCWMSRVIPETGQEHVYFGLCEDVPVVNTVGNKRTAREQLPSSSCLERTGEGPLRSAVEYRQVSEVGKSLVEQQG